MDLEYGPEYNEFRKEVRSIVKDNEGVNLIGESLRSTARVAVSYTHLTLPTKA